MEKNDTIHDGSAAAHAETVSRSVGDMTVGKPMGGIVRFAIPLILGYILQQMYLIIDAVIVGRWIGVGALAAVGASSSVTFLIMGFCNGACAGFAIPVAQAFGAKDFSKMRSYVSNAVRIGAVMAAVVTVMSCMFCGRILRVVNTPDDIFGDAYTFLMMQFTAIPFTFGFNLLAGQIRALGNSRQPFYFLIAASVVNILLDVLLIGEGFDKTVEIAIGDNLLLQPWIKTLVRVNKSFIVQRSVGLREMLASSKRLSEYMHFAIAEKQQPIWIAQREGRAKDSDDRTQESLLKMMTMGGEGTPLQRLKSLHIVPLTISYEYDPCDFLKAQEFQQKRDNPDFRKSGQDDLDNMQTGIFGYKGKIHYHMARPANTWLDELEGLPKAEFYAEAARRIDREIHSHYALFANNYAALDLLEGTHRFAAHYTAEELACFEQYLEGQMQKIQLPQGADRDFLRERMLTMYANPARNQMSLL